MNHVSNLYFFKTGKSHVNPLSIPCLVLTLLFEDALGEGGGWKGPEESSVLAQIIESVKVKYLCSFCPACFSCFPAKQEVRAPAREQIVDLYF